MSAHAVNAPAIIGRKRDGEVLGADEISNLVAAFTAGDISEAQMSAFAMAVFFQGMTAGETGTLTRAMLESGDVLVFPENTPPRIDKHSTGGIGDKVSLTLAPLLAADGNWVPMISGRGLGITGGTLDKLESIPGYRTDLDNQEIVAVLEAGGAVITGQTDNLCPADRKLYALRDVTGTVPSEPLIVSSIMSKKLAEGLDRLVLDVKHGAGAFMKTVAEAESLGNAMQVVGEQFGVRTGYVLSPMDEPVGASAGNALEVVEAIEALKGGGPDDFRKLVLDLAGQVSDSTPEQLAGFLDDGTAWTCFQKMVEAQGGDVDSLEKLGEIHRAPFVTEIKAIHSGTVTRVDASEIGWVVLELGGGRLKPGDDVDFRVGVDQLCKVGDELKAGDCLMRIHGTDAGRLGAFAERLLHAVTVV